MSKNSKQLAFWIFAAVLIVGGAIYFKSLSSSDFLWRVSDGGALLLPLIAVSALVDSINPCAFSVLLLTIAFLFSVGKMKEQVLKVGLIYIFGIFLAYLLIGLGILQALHLFGIPRFMGKAGAVLLVLFGILNVVNVVFPKFPLRLHIPQSAHHKMADFIDKGSVPAAFLLGALVGVCEFPCTGGPYLAILGLLHDKSTFVDGFGYLLFYNFIFVLPLMVLLFIAANKKMLEKVQAWQAKERGNERLIAGVIMVILGGIIFLI